ncbi:MAG: HAMP domain-containing sensor histidine kinase [Lachnospiraceae bacterium]|nr:HAMP domain-containing sensor histidine kinase [Lachnospiraceae bacterium]
MEFFRNPEIQKSIAVWLGLTGVFTASAAWLSLYFGVLAFIFGLVFFLVFLSMTYMRYRRMAEMSLEIDRILHDCSHFELNRFSEGELSILSSEVYKMTVRLREQADALQKDKTYLADSLADISHQIRTPLTSIHLIANFLSEEDLGTDRRLKLTQDLFRQLSRIDWLITTLLKLSKLDTGTVQMEKNPVSVSRLLKKASELVMIPMELREQKLLVSSCSDADFHEKETILGDITWLTEAVGNLLKNCMEHTPHGGSIFVEIRETALFTELKIRDTGEGFAEDDIPHLFERFYKGKNAAENSIGIGLALSSMIIREHHGVIRAENGKMGGAQFTLRFYKITI